MSDQLPGLPFDRLKRAVSAFVRELLPSLDFYRSYVYQVASWDNGSQTGELVPSAGIPMPNLSKVPIRSSTKVTIPEGQEVVVSFDNGDQTKPFISHLATSASGNQLDAIDLSRSDDILPGGLLTARRVVRYGDTIMMPLGAGGVPTPTVVAANPLGLTDTFSRVKA